MSIWYSAMAAQEDAPRLMNAPEDESIIIRSCLSGDRSAWDTFVERYAPFIYSAVRKVLRPAPGAAGREEADRAFSEVFHELFRNDFQALRAFSGKSKLTTYLYVIAMRKCSLLRKEALAETTEGPEPDLLEAREPGPQDAAQQEERRRLLRTEMEKLPRRDQEALNMFYFQGLTYAEIGSVLGISPEHAGMVVKRARDRLKPLLKKYRDSL